MDAIEAFKERAKQGWGSFVGMENATASVATRVVKVARVARGQRVLDVGSGTGVVALAAARLGADVTASDLTPALLARAEENARIAGEKIAIVQADAEALPFEDASFDVVLSQFGHMFAPRPEVATREMLRVLKPGGMIAFCTWPAHLFTGRMFVLTAKYAPPPPPDAVSPVLWGDPAVVEERLGDRVRDLFFTMDTMRAGALSAQHVVHIFESFGPMERLVTALRESAPEKLDAFRRELTALVELYFEDNSVRQDFLVTRAIKI